MNIIKRYILLVSLFACFGCFESNVIDIPDDVENFDITINLKSYKYQVIGTAEDCKIIQQGHVECQSNIINNWLLLLSKVKFIDSKKTQSIKLMANADQLLGLKVNAEEFDFIVQRAVDTCHLRIYTNINAQVKRTAGYISNEDCELFLNVDKYLRDKNIFPKVFEQAKVEYKNKQSTRALSPLVAREVLKYLRDAEFVKFAHTGAVEGQVKKQLFIGLKRNENITGELRLIKGKQQLALQFGRPVEGSPVVNVWRVGSAEVKQYKISSWRKFRNLIVSK